MVSDVLGLEVAKRCRRLNVEFPLGCPSLDDAASLCLLIDRATEHYQSDPIIQEVLNCLISSQFHFEVSSRPIRRRRHVSFSGRILCNIEHGDRLEFFIRVLRERKAEFSINGKFTTLNNVGEYNGAEFELPILGTVTDLQKPLEIFLCWNVANNHHRERISGSPFCLNEIMEAQAWDSPQSRARRHQVKPGRKRGLDCHAAWQRMQKPRWK